MLGRSLPLGSIAPPFSLSLGGADLILLGLGRFVSSFLLSLSIPFASFAVAASLRLPASCLIRSAVAISLSLSVVCS
jgi:hypothetical protein